MLWLRNSWLWMGVQFGVCSIAIDFPRTTKRCLTHYNIHVSPSHDISSTTSLSNIHSSSQFSFRFFGRRRRSFVSIDRGRVPIALKIGQPNYNESILILRKHDTTDTINREVGKSCQMERTYSNAKWKWTTDRYGGVRWVRDVKMIGGMSCTGDQWCKQINSLR